VSAGILNQTNIVLYWPIGKDL